MIAMILILGVQTYWLIQYAKVSSNPDPNISSCWVLPDDHTVYFEEDEDPDTLIENYGEKFLGWFRIVTAIMVIGIVLHIIVLVVS